MSVNVVHLLISGLGLVIWEAYVGFRMLDVPEDLECNESSFYIEEIILHSEIHYSIVNEDCIHSFNTGLLGFFGCRI